MRNIDKIEIISLTVKEYKCLLEDSYLLSDLESEGVDNWMGWEETHDESEIENREKMVAQAIKDKINSELKRKELEEIIKEREQEEENKIIEDSDIEILSIKVKYIKDEDEISKIILDWKEHKSNSSVKLVDGEDTMMIKGLVWNFLHKNGCLTFPD